MKQHSTCLMLIALLVSTMEPLAFAQQANQRLATAAVLDLAANGVSETDVSSLSERMRYEMFRTGVFNMMERGKMQDILKEQGFQQTGACNTDACAVEVGQLIGVEKMVAGSLGRVGKTYTVILRLIDVRTGKVEHSVAQDYEGAIDKLMTEVLRSVAIQMAFAVKNGQQAMAPGALPAPIKRPFYAKWWFWTGLGTAAAGTVAAVLMGKDDGSGATPADTAYTGIDFPPVHP